MNHPPTSVGGNPSPKETGIHLPCPLCSLRFSTSSGLKRHIASHQRNPTAHLAHLADVDGFKCTNCGLVFNSQIGLSQHRRRTHPMDYNKEKLARRPTSQYNWSTLEDASLKRMASELHHPGEAKKVLYTKLATLIPTRSAEAIKKRLQHLGWNPLNSNETTEELRAPSLTNSAIRNQPTGSTRIPITTGPTTCSPTEHPPCYSPYEQTDSPHTTLPQGTDPNILSPRQQSAHSSPISNVLPIHNGSRTFDNNTTSPNTPHFPPVVQSSLQTERITVDDQSNFDNPCDFSSQNPTYTNNVDSQLTIPFLDTIYRLPAHVQPVLSLGTRSPSDINTHHVSQTLMSTCPISQSLSSTTHGCSGAKTTSHTQTSDLTLPPPNISLIHDCLMPSDKFVHPANIRSPPSPLTVNHPLALCTTHSIDDHPTDELTEFPLDNFIHGSHVHDVVPHVSKPQDDVGNTPPIHVTPAASMDCNLLPAPRKQQPSLSRTTAKISHRGCKRRSDQLTLTSLWGAHRTSQQATPTAPQQTTSTSTPRHPEQLQCPSLNVHRSPNSSLSSIPTISTQGLISNTDLVTDVHVTTTATSRRTNDETPATEVDGFQPALFLNKELRLSPELADAVCLTQPPLIFDSLHTDNGLHLTDERISSPTWLSADANLQRLFCSAKEQIQDCPPNDRLAELRSLLDVEASVSLDTFRTALEELCSRKFPATWKPAKRRYQRRITYKNNRQLRRIQFGHIQNLYKRRRKDAASTVLDGRWRNAHFENNFKFPGFNDYWTRLLKGEKISDTRPSRTLLPLNDTLVAPITPGDVSRALNDMQGSAPGPDRLTPADLSKYRPASLSALFNSFLLSGNLPKALNLARITFVPKTAIPSSPSDFRPISISSVVTRCFHKILFDRWCRSFPLDRQQFGFLRRDGCFEMSSILHSAIRYSHSSCKSLSFANIDISKAFDHISHDSLLRAASSYGAPLALLSYLRNVYSTGVSFFDNFSFSTLRGVRQGDPLSPLLFIMSLDEALTNSYDPNLTFQTPGGELDYLAYADDVILFASSKDALSIRLERLQAELREIGLSINLGKTFCTHIVADGRRKTTMLADQPTLIASTTIPSSSVLSSWKVLGIPFNWKGKLPTTAKKDACDMLQELTQAPLKPQQRVEILRSHLIPRLIHQLTLGVVHQKTLKTIDLAVKSSLRKWLRLPNDTSNAFFHAAINAGGLGIPHLQSRIPLNRKFRLDRHLASQNRILHWALREPSSQPFHRLALKTTVVGGEVVTSKEQAEIAWRNSLWNTYDGAGLRDTPTLPQSHNWLRHPESLRPSTFIRAVKLRAGVLPTKSRRSRGRPAVHSQLTCRCGTAVESISHILQTCPITHDSRCRRHNDVVNSIAKTLRRKGVSFLLEPHIPFANSYLKPDLIVFKGSCVYIADIAICDPHRMTATIKLKKEKYGSSEAVKATSDFLRGWNRRFTKIVQAPIVFNNRGFLHPTSFHPLSCMNIPKSQISDLCLLCICGSLKTYDAYMRGCNTMTT